MRKTLLNNFITFPQSLPVDLKVFLFQRLTQDLLRTVKRLAEQLEENPHGNNARYALVAELFRHAVHVDFQKARIFRRQFAVTQDKSVFFQLVPVKLNRFFVKGHNPVQPVAVGEDRLCRKPDH
jgi:hypothetical protein